MATATGKVTEIHATAREAFVDRVLRSAAGAFDVFTIYIGDRLGFYEVLADNGPMTTSELAARTGTHERYVREWLEQQTVAGILKVDDEDAPAGKRRFSLPPGHDEVLADRESLDYLAPMAQLVAGAVYPLEAVLQAYRNGGGVPFEAYGRDLREGQARMNRAMFLQQLGNEWIPSIPGLRSRLEADPPARVADVGCGAGWSSIGIAACYPKVSVDGFDLDAPSIELARANAKAYGVSGRVSFHVRDAGEPELAGKYNLVAALECIHDMSRPVEALRAMRRLAKGDGFVLVVDERVGDKFTAEGEGLEGLMYGFSVLHCLPSGMVDEESACTGTVMRADTLRDYAREAGFRDVEILPVDHLLFRFYRLVL